MFLGGVPRWSATISRGSFTRADRHAPTTRVWSARIPRLRRRSRDPADMHARDGRCQDLESTHPRGPPARLREPRSSARCCPWPGADPDRCIDQVQLLGPAVGPFITVLLRGMFRGRV